jgi:O-antigen ligase
MTSSRGSLHLLASGVFFALLSVLIILWNPGYFIPLMMLCAMTGLGFLVHIFGFHYAFVCLLASLPVSIAVEMGGGSTLLFPSELLVVTMVIAVFIHWIQYPSRFEALFRHPVTWMLCGYAVFMAVSACFSEMVLVSVKAAAVRTIYLIVFYGGAFIWFTQRKPAIGIFNSYIMILVPVILFVLTKHLEFGFSKDVTTYITKPFFSDHTIYSAVIVFLIPFAILMAIKGTGSVRWLFGCMAVLMTFAVLIAASRAAWISVLASMAVLLVIRMRIPRSMLAVGGLVLIALLVVNRDPLLDELRKNRNDSNARNAGLDIQTQSVVNISNDQSNIERLNRWRCAVRMFLEKPLTGFGPGTYQFAYLPFQRDYEMTRISVTSPYHIMEGRGGTAHNEFLLVLSESGIFAAVCFLLAFLMVFAIAYRVNVSGSGSSGLSLAIVLALVSFATHSLFNNFMDTDKGAALVYISFAFFVRTTTPETIQNA